MELKPIDAAPRILREFFHIKDNAHRIDFRERGSGPRKEGEFDPNDLFKALTHIRLQPGYVLDFYYSYCHMAGHPWLYARSIEAAPFKTEQYDEIFRCNREEISKYQPELFLTVDGSPEGYFEFIVFDLLASQFYLFWHALYNDLRLMTTQKDVDQIIKPKTRERKFRSEAKRIDPTVTFEMDGGHCSIYYWVFSDWGGFTRIRATFQIDSSPATYQTEVLDKIEYDCGMCY